MNKSELNELVKEWCDGVFPIGFEVLDIGAGISPTLGCTRAVDINRELFTKDGKKLKKKVCIPNSLIEYINYDAKALPYADMFFDRVVSRWAIGARIKGIGVIREAFRVLKNGGAMYIAILEEDKSAVSPTRRNLKRVGFKSLHTYQGEYLEDGAKGEVRAKEHLIFAKKV